MNFMKNNPFVLMLVVSILFGLLKYALDQLIGFSYGDSSTFSRVAHDVGMMLWGGVLVSLLRWAKDVKARAG